MELKRAVVLEKMQCVINGSKDHPAPGLRCL
jgi:hypothetical protein